MLYLRHGIGGDETEWIRFATPDALFDNLIADKVAVPMIYVRSFPDGGHKRQISMHGGTVAAGARDGRRLFYQTADQRIMVVDWSVSDGVPQPAQPRFWTDARLADLGLAPSFDVAHDGRVAALIAPPSASGGLRITSH